MPPLLIGLLSLVALVILSSALGLRLLRWAHWRADDPVSEAFICIGLGLGALQFLPFLLLCAGIGTPVIIRISALVLGVLLLPDVISFLRQVQKQARSRWALQWWEWALLATVSCLLALIFLRTVLPATDIDVLSYHLTGPLRFFSEGRFHHILTITPTNWPMAVEFLYGILITIYPDAPVGVVPFLFGVIVIALVYLIARRIGSRLSAALAIVLLLLQWVFWWEMSTGMIDIASACFALLSLLVLDSTSGRRNELPAIVLTAILAGLAATTKLQGICVIASILIVLYLRGRQGGTPVSLKRCLLFGAVAFLIVAPWYVKTWIVTENPLYPLFQPVFGGNELSASGSERYVSLYRLIDASHGLPSSVPLTQANIMLYSGIRVVVAVVGSVLVIWLSRNYPNAVLMIFSSAFATFICLTGSFHIRFLLPAYVTGVAGISYVAHRWGSVTAIPIVAAAIIFTVEIAHSRLHPDLPLAWAVSIGSMEKDEYLRSGSLRDYPAVEFANRELPTGSRILLGTDNENTAMLRHASFWANYWLQDSFHYDSHEHLLSDIRRLEITHLLLVRQFPPWFANHAAWKVRVTLEHTMSLALANRHGREIFSDTSVVLYELDVVGNEQERLK